MRTITTMLIAAIALAIPASARPSRDLGPLGSFTWTAETVRIVLTRLDLGRSQRDKVFELIGDARKDAAEVSRNRRLSMYQRQERLTDISTEMRSRIIHVLTNGQKDRLRDILAGNRNDGPSYRPGNGPRDSRSRPDDRAYRGRNNARDNRSRGDGPDYRTPDNRQDRNDWPWE